MELPGWVGAGIFVYIFFFVYHFRSALLNKHTKKIHFSFYLRTDKTPGMEFN